MPAATTNPGEVSAPMRQGGRCIVLSPPGASGLGVLMPALTGRWASVLVVSDEPGVMEELGRGGVSVVVVVRPAHWAWLKPLALAIGQHHGQVMCMQFDDHVGDQNTRITALASRWMETPHVTTEAPPSEQPGPLSGEAAPLQFTGHTTDAPAPRPADQDPAHQCDTPDDASTRNRRRLLEELAVQVPLAEASAQPVPELLVTEEELSMLLGPAPVEAG